MAPPMPFKGRAAVGTAAVPSAEIVREHLGRTGAATPPPSAPWMLSNSAMEVLRQPSREKILGGTLKMSSTTRVSTSRLMKRRDFSQEDAEAQGKFATAKSMQGLFAASSSLGSSFSSGALPSSWRRTWSDAGAFPSPTLRRAVEAQVMGSERDLSTPARLANKHAETKMQQYTSAQQLSRSRRDGSDIFDQSDPEANRSLSSLNIPSASALFASHKDRVDAFKDDALEVENLIQTLTSSLRLDGVKTTKEARELDRMNREREETRRRIAVEERAARAQEAAARDPHKKVNLKVENTKKFGMTFLDELHVPMQAVGFTSESGVQHVKMVDILQIRQRCKRCDDLVTPTVEQLIDDQTRTDRLHGRDPKTGKSKAESAGNIEISDLDLDETLYPDRKPTLALTIPLDGKRTQSKLAATGQTMAAPRSRLPQVLTEGKLAMLQSRKSQAHIQNMLYRLNKMRSPPSEATLYNLEHLAGQASRELAIAGTFRTDGATVGRKRVTHKEANDTVEPLKGSELTPVPTPRSMVRSTRKTISEKTMASPTGRSKSISAKHECDPEVRERAMRALKTFRFAVSVTVLWMMVQKKRKAMGHVKHFLNTCGEWARMRLSMTRLRKNITTLQRGCRQFLLSKRKRCELMSKEWQHVEDLYLPKHFKALAEKTIQEQNQKQAEKQAGKNAEGSVKLQMALQRQKTDVASIKIAKMMQGQIDWKMYRIPAKDRKAVLSRYYMVHLKQKVNSSGDLMAAVHDLVQIHQETLGFLRLFGADESQARDLRSMATGQGQHASMPVKHEDFWILSKDATLDLIAFAASQMPRTDEETGGMTRWRDHPANREITGMENPMYRHAVKTKGDQPKGTDFLTLMASGARRPQHLTSQNQTTAAQPQDKKAEALPDFDVDELWRTFTPRLREVTAKPLSPNSERPSSRPGLGEQDQAAWHLAGCHEIASCKNEQAAHAHNQGK